MDLESRKPMAKDGIFRLASMSKPITAAAVMMLVEEGKVRLERSGVALHPRVQEHEGGRAAAGPRGARRAAGRGGAPEFDLVSASREITVRDLLTHGSGLASGGLGASKTPERGANDTLASYIPKLGAVPLDFQPGTLWRYSGLAGFDVLSRIVEVASGQTYDRFLRERLLDPLGMKDTGFRRGTRHAAPGHLYRRTPGGKLERVPDQNGLSSPTYFSGAGGHGEHGRGLRAVRADAAERRRAERPPLSRQADRGADGLQPHGRHGERPVRPPGSRDGLRPGRAGGLGSGGLGPGPVAGIVGMGGCRTGPT